MRFVSSREIRMNPEPVFESLEENEVVITVSAARDLSTRKDAHGIFEEATHYLGGKACGSLP